MKIKISSDSIRMKIRPGGLTWTILKDDDFDEFDIKIDDDNEDGNVNENIVVEFVWKTFDI